MQTFVAFIVSVARDGELHCASAAALVDDGGRDVLVSESWKGECNVGSSFNDTDCGTGHGDRCDLLRFSVDLDSQKPISHLGRDVLCVHVPLYPAEESTLSDGFEKVLETFSRTCSDL